MRIALAQLNYKIGDFAANFAKIKDTVERYHQQADLIVFSELCLSGYYPKDLIGDEKFIALQNLFLAQTQQLTQQFKVDLIIGFIDKNNGKGKPYHNSLCLLSQNQRHYTYHKRLLPVYNIFDESRHFAPGKLPGIYTYQHIKIGFLICEDGWVALDSYLYEIDTVGALSDQNLDVIICINGSPSNVGKQEDRLRHFSAIAQRCQSPLIFVNQVGGNDEIVFDGASFLLDKQGQLLGKLPSFEQAIGIFSIKHQHITPIANFSIYVPISNVTLFYEQTILGLRDYVSKCGFQTVVIGVSGGIDSALTLALAVKALGAHNVSAIAMPSRYSSLSSITDAQALCEIFQVKLYIASIEEQFLLSLNQFEQVFKQKPTSLTEQNMQARLRGRILMEYSNQTGALVLSTGNKSEISVGYTTLYGDMAGGLNLIGDLYKTDVYLLAEYFNQRHPNSAILRTIIEKAPSAELTFDQKDSDSLPPYHVLDPILKLYIEGDLLPEVEKNQCKASLQNVSPLLINQVYKMIAKAEFKRRQSPPIIRIQRRAFGYGRQFPIAASYPSYFESSPCITQEELS